MELTGYNIKKKTNIASKEAQLAADIYEWSGKKINYPLLLKFIKEKGYKATWEIWADVKQRKGIREPYVYFMTVLMREEIEYEQNNQGIAKLNRMKSEAGLN